MVRKWRDHAKPYGVSRVNQGGESEDMPEITGPVNVQEIMQKIRRARIRDGAAARHPVSVRDLGEWPDWATLEKTGLALEHTSSLVGQLPPEPPTFRGRMGAFFVKIVHRALFWYTPQIVRFQTTVTLYFKELLAAMKTVADNGQQSSEELDLVTRRVAELKAEAERLGKALETRHEEIRTTVESLSKGVLGELEGLSRALGAEARARGELARQLDAESASRASLEQALAAEIAAREELARQRDTGLIQLRAEVINQNRRISILLEEARKRLPAPLDQTQLCTISNERNHTLDALYVSFEDRFRGTRADIKERFRIYLPLLEEQKIGIERTPVLDLGCGRGEWLELLAEHKLTARGIDINRVLLAWCREAGMNVEEADLLEYLKNNPPKHSAR